MYRGIIWFTPTIFAPCFTVSHFPWTSFVSPQVHALIPLPDTVTSSGVGIHEVKVMIKAILPRGNKTQAPHRCMWLVWVISRWLDHPPDTALCLGPSPSSTARNRHFWDDEQQLQ